MPRMHALELLPDADGEATLRRDWQRLRDAGLPSMLDHAGATNTPHLTIIAVPTISADDERRAVELIGSLLPIRARTSGLVVLGGQLVTLARTVEVDDDVVRAVLELRAGTSGHQHRAWLPHLTLARRLPRHDLQRAIDAITDVRADLELVALRRWDPDAAQVRPL